MVLADLLERGRSVPPLSPNVRDTTRDVLLAAAHQDVLRRAKIARLWRTRRIRVGFTAAAALAVAITVVSQDAIPTSPPLTPAPSTIRTAEFTTVAQVIHAAAAAPVDDDPGAAPYWKVVTRWPCPPAIKNPPPGGICGATLWIGNGRPGVFEDRSYRTPITTATRESAYTVTFEDQTLTWSQVNARTWTQRQVVALVAEGRPPTLPASVFVFNTASDFLAEDPVPPSMRKQLWNVLAALPGVTLQGRAKDSLGRTGWLLTLSLPGWGTQSVLIDPESGKVLEVNGSVRAGGAITATTVVSAGPAETAPTP